MRIFLENKNIKLRAVEPEDVDVLLKWENDTSIWKLSNTLTPFSKNILKQYIANAHLDIYQAKQLRLIIETNDKKPIGCIDLFDFDPFHGRAGIGILIADKENRGKGYASEALDVLIDYAFNILSLHQLYCNITEDNKESLKLFEKKGFVKVGVKKDWIKSFDNYIDEYLLQLVKELKS